MAIPAMVDLGQVMADPIPTDQAGTRHATVPQDQAEDSIPATRHTRPRVGMDKTLPVPRVGLLLPEDRPVALPATPVCRRSQVCEWRDPAVTCPVRKDPIRADHRRPVIMDHHSLTGLT